MELVVEKLVVALVGGWNGGEREREREIVEIKGRGASFWPTLNLIFFLLKP